MVRKGNRKVRSKCRRPCPCGKQLVFSTDLQRKIEAAGLGGFMSRLAEYYSTPLRFEMGLISQVRFYGWGGGGVGVVGVPGEPAVPGSTVTTELNMLFGTYVSEAALASVKIPNPASFTLFFVMVLPP